MRRRPAGPRRRGRPRRRQAGGAGPAAARRGRAGRAQQGRSLPARRRDHGRPGRRLPGHPRRHLRLAAPRPGVRAATVSCFVEDLGSTNGTYLNRSKVAGPMVMHAGRPLQVGNTVHGAACDGRLRVGRGHRRRPGAHGQRGHRARVDDRCSPWPTAWAATAAARSPVGAGRRLAASASSPSRRTDGVAGRGGAARPTTPSCERRSTDPDLHGMGTTLCAIAPGRRATARATGRRSTSATRASTCSGRRAHPAVTDDHSLVEDLVREGRAHRRRGRGPPAAQHPHPGARHRRRVEVDAWDGPAGRAATATCSAATACSTRSTTAASPRAAPAGRPHRGGRRAGARWPTRPAAATTSPWSWSTSSTTTAGRRPSEAAGAEPADRRSVADRRRRRRRSATSTAAADAVPTPPERAPSRPSVGDEPTRPAAAERSPSAGHLAGRPVRRCSSSPSSAWPSAPSATTAGTRTSSAFDGDQVVIFQGRPAACCGSSPTVDERTGIDRGRRAAASATTVHVGQASSSIDRRPARTSPTSQSQIDSRCAPTTTTTTDDDHHDPTHGHRRRDAPRRVGAAPTASRDRRARRNTELGLIAARR